MCHGRVLLSRRPPRGRRLGGPAPCQRQAPARVPRSALKAWCPTSGRDESVMKCDSHALCILILARVTLLGQRWLDLGRRGVLWDAEPENVGMRLGEERASKERRKSATLTSAFLLGRV